MNAATIPMQSPESTNRPTLRSFRFGLLAATALIFCFMLVRYRAGEDTFVFVPDCLDVAIPTMSVFAKSDVFFSGGNAVFEQELGGLPRNTLPGELYLPILPYRLMSAFHAYVFDDLVTRIVAMAGMALLLRRHLLPHADDRIVLGAALCFGLLPFYPYGLSVAGQPFLFYAVLNLGADDRSLWNWLIVAIYPFVSSPVLVGFMIVPLVAFYGVYRAIATRRLPWSLVFAFLLLVVGYLAGNYRLFLQHSAGAGSAPHRVEFVNEGVGLERCLIRALWGFRGSQVHAASLQNPIILIAALWGLLHCLPGRPFQRLYGRYRAGPTAGGGDLAPAPAAALAWLVMACALVSLGAALYDWNYTQRLLDAMRIGILRSLNLGRVAWLLPLLWGLVFAVALDLIHRLVRWGGILATALILGQAMLAAYSNQQELTPVDGGKHFTFHSFLSPELFQDVRAYIGEPASSYRVASLGIYPAIPFYNGFYTADGYHYDYPLEYKHRFRKVIAAELAKSAVLKDYFDGWGSRCYLFSSELGKKYEFTRTSRKRKVKKLDIDTAALYDLDVRYILSAVKIVNAPSLGLELEKVFERDDSPWQIYLYRLKVPPPQGLRNSNSNENARRANERAVERAQASGSSSRLATLTARDTPAKKNR